jgi:hypothetical protein
MRIAPDRPALGLALLLALPAGAQESGLDCAALAAGLGSLPGYRAEVPPAGPEDGACVLDGARLDSQRPGWPDLRAERLRIGAGEGWLSLDLAGLRVAPRAGDPAVDERLRSVFRLQTADLRANATAGPEGLQLSDVDLRLSGGMRLALSARLAGGDLSPASLPGAALTDLTLEWRSDGRLPGPIMAALGGGLAEEGASDAAATEAARAGLVRLIAALPEAALTEGSREALEAMAADLPMGRGKLVLRLTAAEGIGAADLGLAALSDDPLGPAALARLLAGTRLSADWQPGLQP